MERMLPHNLGAERATLGACLLDREAIVPVAAWLKSEHFYVQAHAHIYAAQLACYHRRVPPDLTTVAEELRRMDRLDQIGGVPFLIELTNDVPTAYHAEYYAQIVERTATLRGLIQAGAQITARGYGEADDLERILDAAEQDVFTVTQRRTQRDFVSLATIAEEFLAKLQRAEAEPDSITPLMTGLHDLDRILGGMYPGDLVCFAARPGVGKSAIVKGIAEHNAAHHGHRVGVVSLEMGREQWLLRFAAEHAGYDVQSLRDVHQIVRSLPMLQRVTDALGVLAALPILIDDATDQTLGTVRAKARRVVAEQDAKLLVVDYLQLMQTGQRHPNRQEEVSALSRGLKTLARELDIPIIILSQLNRELEKRANKVPMLSDLRESGAVEQDCDVIAFLHRPAMYVEAKDKPLPGQMEPAEIHVAKQRNGPLGEVQVLFDGATTTFRSLDTAHSPEGY